MADQPAQESENPYVPKGPQPYVVDQFAGINTATTRVGVDDKQLWACDGFFPYEPGNLKVLPGASASQWSSPAGANTIVFYKFGNIGTAPYAIIVLTDGSVWVLNTATLVSTNILPAGTLTNPEVTNTDIAQWGNQYIIIVNEAANLNGYYLWDGTLTYYAGTLAPGVTLTNGGMNYTSPPTVTASGGNGAGATFVAQISPTGAVVSVTINTPNNSYPLGGSGLPTISVSGGGGTGAVLTPNWTFIGLGPGGESLYQLSSVTISNGGAGFTSAPTLTLTGGLPPITATTLTAVVATVSPVTSVIMTNPGNGYLATDTVTLNFSGGGGTGAAATVSLMPFGLYGNAVETYAGRVWIANINNLYTTAPGSLWDIATSVGGVSTQSSDSFLKDTYVKLVQTNGFLYLIADSSINYISNVQTSGTPPVTTYSNQNADPEVGTTWPATVGVWGQNIIFANTWGVQISYGARVSKISMPLDGIYGKQSPVLGISAAKALIFNRKVWMLLIPVVDQLTGNTMNKLCMWDGNKWFTSQQNVPLTFIATQEINSVLTAWGTDGTSLYTLFTTPSTAFVKYIQTKLWGTPGGPLTLKALSRLWGLMQYNSGNSPELTFEFDNEEGSQTGVTVNTAVDTGEITVVVTTAIGQTGTVLGTTMSTTADDMSIIMLAMSPEVVGYQG